MVSKAERDAQDRAQARAHARAEAKLEREVFAEYPTGGHLDDGNRRGMVRELGPVVDVDTLIDRPDLGPGAATLVKAGDRVPLSLADYDRRPAPEQPAPEAPEQPAARKGPGAPETTMGPGAPETTARARRPRTTSSSGRAAAKG